jgi:hypothetical protein
VKELETVDRLVVPRLARKLGHLLTYIGERFLIGERFPRPGYRGGPKRASRRGASVVLGQIELVGGDHRDRGRGEGGQLELPVEVSPPDFPVAQGVFEMQSAFPGLRGLGEFA